MMSLKIALNPFNLFFFFVVSLGVMFLSGVGFGEKVTENVPAVSLPVDNYDFGTVFESDEVIHAFIIRNTGVSPLKINKVKPG